METRAGRTTGRSRLADEAADRLSWCPHSIEDHDGEGCDVVIEVAGYEYICNCGQTPDEIREYLKAS